MMLFSFKKSPQNRFNFSRFSSAPPCHPTWWCRWSRRRDDGVRGCCRSWAQSPHLGGFDFGQAMLRKIQGRHVGEKSEDPTKTDVKHFFVKYDQICLIVVDWRLNLVLNLLSAILDMVNLIVIYDEGLFGPTSRIWNDLKLQFFIQIWLALKIFDVYLNWDCANTCGSQSANVIGGAFTA